MSTIVIALGGNALQDQGSSPTAENQLAVVKKTATNIAGLARNNRLLIVHGNGPQVGRLVLQNEFASAITPAMPFDVCAAMSQGLIGYHLQQGMNEALANLGIPSSAVTLLTQVLVDENDKAFMHPSKPIGPFYSSEEAQCIMKEKGYVLKEDAGRGFRRVVPSPEPIKIIELDAIKLLLENGFIPICVGGGGIPVIKDNRDHLSGIAAVIDKDLAAERLAEDIDADTLLILTAVEQVCLNYQKPDQLNLSQVCAAEMERYIERGHFAPGSMLPKMQAALRFANSAPSRRAIITSLEMAIPALDGKAGTIITA
ncbi:MAG: carbamate kinase [Clostridiales bacterium]|nr:carbamate kinase [Clostridiales bacterium]